jgi:O-methyltransferase domain/Dimerisation domain
VTVDDLSLRDTLRRLTNGFQVSQAIHVAATLGIADLLGEGPRSIDDLAVATGTSAPALTRLLRALASVGIFADVGGRIGQTPLSNYLRADVTGSLRAWAMRIGRPDHWRTWGELERSVRSGAPAFPELYGATAWDWRAAHPEENAIFNAAMTGISAGMVDSIVAAYDFSQFRSLVDVGGGEGALLAAILTANHQLRGIVFDLPHVVTGAKDVLERAGVTDRCQLMTGSFFETVPPGADAYILKSIIHDWDDAAALAILRRCRVAVPDSGRLLLVEHVLKAVNEADPARFSDLNMLVILGGQERDPGEFERLCAGAGFRLTAIIPTASAYSVIEARPE